jgi:hypothetical protein
MLHGAIHAHQEDTKKEESLASALTVPAMIAHCIALLHLSSVPLLYGIR